ncbi:heparinase II/III family protein [uncultured Draconibacterium sp.]|uniref:heparinase II/III domain-containing protein n=1 Tax=uncultured Draconibacterium sp. TaxID=1573823 RepID=UPI00326168F6
MKRISLILFITIFSLTAYAQKRNYFLVTENNVKRLKSEIEKSEEVRNAWNIQLEKASQLMQKDRNSLFDARVLGLVYRMTGEKKYANRIKVTLLREIQRDTWEEWGLLQRDPAWNAGLRTAHATFNAALGFDCIYDCLTDDERKKIADGIVRLGINRILGDWINPTTNIHTFDTMGHNWWSGVVDIGGIAALAVRNEVPEAQSWVETISNASVEWLNYAGSVLQNKIPTFDRNGGFWESINYANFGVSQYLMFRLAHKNVHPKQKLPEMPQMETLIDFFIHTTYYTDSLTMSVNFGDGYYLRNGHACAKLLWNLGYQNEKVHWYLHKTNHAGNHEMMTNESALGLILNPVLPEKIETPELATSQLQPDMGWAMMRNSWNDNASFLAVKSGLAWNHAHADAGSYILFHKGKYLIIDSGNASYGNPLYTKYYCQSEAHNVVLWNGKGEEQNAPYFGSVNHGSLHNLLDAGKLKYLLANATGPYSKNLSRNYRSFLWVEDVILVIDDLLAYEPGIFEWLLHYNGESKRRGQNLSIKDGDAEVMVKPLFPETFPDGGLPHDFPEQMTLEERWGWEDHHPENKVPYWSVSHFEETLRTKFVTAIVLKNDKNKDDLPLVERFEGKDFLGVRITQNNETTEVYFNLLADGRLKHRNSIINMNGWDTDAYLMALTFKEGTDRSDVKNIADLFVTHGSYIRRDGQVLVHALSKYTAHVKDFGNQPELHFQGQQNIDFQVYYRSSASVVLVNNKHVKSKYNSDLKLIKIKLD